MNNECAICTEKMNMTTRKQITCEHCSFVHCLSCFKMYMQQTFPQVRCMNCKEEFSVSFIRKNVPKIFFFNDYMKSQTHKVVNQQNLKKHKRKIQNKKKYIDHKISKLKKEFNQKQSDFVKKQKDIKLYRKQFPESITIDEAVIKHREVYSEYSKCHEVYLKNLFEINKQSPKYNCFSNSCNGILFGSDDELQCESCHKYVCGKCFIMKDDKNHICDQENIDTTTQLKEQAIPCPNCLSFISKTDGCNDMWCVNCNTAFLWSTGELIRGRFHNPHHTEWLKKDINNERISPSNKTTESDTFFDNLTIIKNDTKTAVSEKTIDYINDSISEDKYFNFVKKNQKKICYISELIQLYNNFVKTEKNIIIEDNIDIDRLVAFYFDSQKEVDDIIKYYGYKTTINITKGNN